METTRRNRGQARYDSPGIGGSCCKGEGGEEAMSAPVNVGKPMLTLLIILGLIGIGSLGYTIGAHNVSVVTMTQPSQLVMETQTVFSVSTETQTSISQVSVVQAVTQAIPLQIAPLPNTQTQFCNYSSFSGDWCAGRHGRQPCSNSQRLPSARRGMHLTSWRHARLCLIQCSIKCSNRRSRSVRIRVLQLAFRIQLPDECTFH